MNEIQNDSDSGESDLYTDTESQNEQSDSFLQNISFTPRVVPEAITKYDRFESQNFTENYSSSSENDSSSIEDYDNDRDYEPVPSPKRSQIDRSTVLSGNRGRGGRGRARGKGQAALGLRHNSNVIISPAYSVHFMRQ